jgi:hypothetical protein
MANPQDEYSTKNLFVAAFLMASGRVRFVCLRSLDYKTKLFCFSPREEAEKLEAEYFSGGALPAKTLFAEYNTLKDLLFNQEPNGDRYGNKNY